jgi:hypothetical protein
VVAAQQDAVGVGDLLAVGVGLDAKLGELVKATGTTLTDLNGIGPSGAARPVPGAPTANSGRSSPRARVAQAAFQVAGGRG